MKRLTTILTAAMIAGSATVAMAQSNSDEVNPGLVGRGADDNPSGLSNPKAGNTAAPPWERFQSTPSPAPSYRTGPSAYSDDVVMSAPVSGTLDDRNWISPSTPPSDNSW